jgi:hypothetical protein
MPQLPSGLMFAISSGALFDHGGNWFKCPDGHFWYWTPDEDIMGPGPYSTASQLLQSAAHAPVPITLEEAKKYVHVLESDNLENWSWRGEWLDQFPRFRTLSPEDRLAWDDWVAGNSTQLFLQETMLECQRLSRLNSIAKGMAMFSSSVPDGTGAKP